EGSLGVNLLDLADLEIDLAHGKVTLFKPDGCRKSALAYWVKQGGTYNGAVATLLDRRAAERVGIDLKGLGVKPGVRIRGVGARTYASWIVPIDTFSV